jgi:hypothetical protein
MLLDQIAAAFDRKDYQTAAQLLKTFLKESPHDPWGQFYRARLYEVSGRLDDAKATYQQILKTVTHPKVISHARIAIQQLQAQETAQRQQEIEAAKADPSNAEAGVLILEAIPPSVRTEAAQALAKIMQIDPYTARMHLPNSGWRLYRWGAIGELKLYGQQLRSANIPAFWAKEREMQQLPVFEVQYFLDYDPQAIVVCHSEQGQLGSLTFDWSEVSRRVEGMLPVFERVVDTTLREGIQRQRKSQTQDYVRICDLHLPTRHCILRICDWRYHFEQGIQLGLSNLETIVLDQSIKRLYWNRLMEFLQHQLSEKPLWSNFISFGETAIDYPILLNRFPAKIHSYGQDESVWNSAFHLYSCLAFVQARSLQ